MWTVVRNSFGVRFTIILILIIGIWGIQPPASVLAATLTVTNTNDSGSGSLRQAIASAVSGDTITFAPSLAGQTITLESDLIINKDLLIDSSGLSPQLTISGGDIVHLVIGNSTFPPTVTISDLTIVHGYSAGDGGAIIVGGTLTLINSTLRNNYAAGDGGAISAAKLTLKNTTLAQNQAGSRGGALLIYGNANSTIVNSTITQNQAGSGGAIAILGTTIIEMIHNTVADNTAASGSELWASSNGSLQLSNTILVCTPSVDGCTIQSGNFFISSTNSLIGTGTIQDFGLAHLADHGGPTQTMALLAGSPLIDAGDDSVCANSSVDNLDQRGVTRPQGSHCDIGAYEYQIATPTFEDVHTDYWAWDFIERLYRAGITGGCGVNPPMYCPEGTVTRAQMAVFLERGIHGSSYNPPAVGGSTGFGDVPIDYWSTAWIKQLAAEGITGGCGSGNYCPEYPVTRSQMAIFLLRSKYGASYSPPAVGGSTGFGDVPSDYWAAAWIKQLVTEGITAGCGNGNYCPEVPVSRAQMAVFLVRTFNLP